MPLKYLCHLTPRDVLFMRDARPTMEASDAGLGANWPRPDQIWSALIHAFRREWPEGPETRPGKRFGDLKTVGPFPCRDGKVFLPMPLDWNMRLIRSENTNLCPPLQYAFLPRKQEKREVPDWISLGDYKRYLARIIHE